MRALLYSKQVGLVDLYYNDLYALKVTISRVQIASSYNSQIQSEADSYSHH